MHVRSQIRECVRALLAAIPSIETSIFFDSDDIPEEEELPCVVVSVGDEDIEHESLGGSTGATLARGTEIFTDVIYQRGTDALLAAEEIAAVIETRMATSSELLDLVRSSFPQAIQISRTNVGKRPAVQMRLSWLVTYSTNERDPTVAIP